MRESFRAQVLPLFVSGLSPSSLAEIKISTQEILDCGRPDIVLRTSDMCAFIEVKLNPRRGFTIHQELIGCDGKDIQTYVSHLEALKVRHRRLVFLLPADFVFRDELESQIAQKKSSPTEIRVEICRWEDVLNAVQLSDDPIVQEFCTVLRQQLSIVTLLPEEKKMLMSEDFPIAFRTTRKLEKLVDQIATSYEDGLKASKESTEYEYGVYFKAGNRYLVWFGLWEVNGRVLLSYAVSHKWESSTLEVFRRCFPCAELQEVGSDVKWTMYPISISDQILAADNTVAVAQIRDKLKMLLHELRGDRAAQPLADAMPS
jgi:hypothetical protein